MRLPLNNAPSPSLGFGVVGWGYFNKHLGIDYPVGVGTPVYAPASGTIRSATRGSDGTTVLEIAIGNYWHRFLHVSQFVRTSGTVQEGELIAYSGKEGPVTGPHLHWDVRIAGTAWNNSFSNYVNPLTLINTQGGEMANRDQVNNLYKGILFREGDAGGLDHYTGKDANFIANDMLNSQERKNFENYIKTLNQSVVNLQEALRNEQNKPPKEIIKEVEKIVEKPVEVIREVKVYEHDEETKKNVNVILNLVQTIFDYFKGQYKTFGKYIKKGK